MISDWNKAPVRWCKCSDERQHFFCCSLAFCLHENYALAPQNLRRFTTVPELCYLLITPPPSTCVNWESRVPGPTLPMHITFSVKIAMHESENYKQQWRISISCVCAYDSNEFIRASPSKCTYVPLLAPVLLPLVSFHTAN